ncbi:MAG: glycoside hydrolase family 38 C-terminal domain-containing protein [Candidatus Nanopelagicales bacterium]
MGSIDDVVRRARAVVEALEAAQDAAAAPMAVEQWDHDGEPLPVPEALARLASQVRPGAVGDGWGPVWGTTWFRLRGRVPDGWSGRPVETVVDLGYDGWGPGFQAEGLVVAPTGDPVTGLHPRRQRVLVQEQAEAGALVELLVEAAANPSAGPGERGTDPVARPAGPVYRLARAELVVPDREARALALDLDVLATLIAVNAPSRGPSRLADDARLDDVVAAVQEACDVVDDGRSPGAADAARARLAQVLGVPAPDDAPRLSLVGHAHLDTAWLWPIRETRRKVVRTTANLLALMDDDPGLTYAASQALHGAWVREDHPALWDRVKERAAEGRWVPVGGMWIESDVLLASGESLARQLVHGQRFFADELGREARTGWLPDCFGFTPALPQLLAQAGIGSFLTQKLSWNDTNRFPHRSFWWEGLDGTRVLCHFPTVDTYNAELGEHDLLMVTRTDSSHRHHPDSLAPTGYGDGGGGPTQEMLERASRMRSVLGLPRTEHVDPDAFFERLRAQDADEALPVWRGDLYLETHRGVWTSQRETKAGDARGDEALRDTETWCATASVLAGAAYPYDALDALWKRHLVLEFHDILPGSSITRVHREAEAEHAAVLEETLALRTSALASLGTEGRQRDTAYAAPSGATLDNDLLRATFDGRGRLVSLVDLAAGRELVAPDEGLGTLRLHRDLPLYFDAWNVDRGTVDDYEQLDDAGSVEVRRDGLRMVRTFGDSTATLTWRLPLDAARLEVEVAVDWHADGKLLSLTWPLDLRAPHVTAGVQHGLLQRPLHANTTWEQARFEDWFHGYLHLAEGPFSVAVVTADAHGYGANSQPRVDGGTTTTLRTSLLRSPAYPDPTADRGRHVQRFALLVGADLEAATRAGHAMRRSLVPGATDELDIEPVVSATGTGVVVDAVKLADDRSGDLVVRVHEALGARTVASVRSVVPVSAYATTDLLERADDEAWVGVAGDGHTVSVPLRPHELRTLRLRRA